MKNLPFASVNYCDGVSRTLDVRLTSHCDSACSFCIAAEDMKDHREFNLEAMVKSTKQAGRDEVSIIGGEPLLFLDKLLQYMERVELEAGIERFYLTTALPYTLITQRDLFCRVMAKVTVLNVSLQHYLNDRNNLILRPKRNFNRIKILEEILAIDDYKSRIRVHLNLSRGGIDSLDQLNEALYTLRAIGVQAVKLNELMNAPDEYISFEEITGIELPSPYAHGCSTTIDYFNGLDILLKRSCFVVENSRRASKRDLLKLMVKEELGVLEKNDATPRVLYEDGMLTNRWQGESL